MARFALVSLAVLSALLGALALAGGSEREYRSPAPRASPAASPAPATSLPAAWDKGFVYTAWSTDLYASRRAARSLDALAATGANAVSIIATQYQRNLRASAVATHAQETPSDRSLAVAIRRAKERGLKVRLRVVVDVSGGALRARIRPARPTAWFASYRRRLLHYARLAERLGVETLEIGVELKGLSGPQYADRWRRLAVAARRSFGGRLSYAALGDEYEQITWWDAVDEIGIDAYFSLSRGGRPSAEAVVAAWSRFVDASDREHRYLDELGAVARRFGRPIVMTELGYPSSTNALVTPWQAGRAYSGAAQRTALAGAFRALAPQPWMKGVYVWQWRAEPGLGGPGDTDHTVQGKPAQRTVRRWYSGRAP